MSEKTKKTIREMLRSGIRSGAREGVLRPAAVLAVLLALTMLCACARGTDAGSASGTVPAASAETAAVTDLRVEEDGSRIIQTGTVGGTEYTFVIDLSRWAGHSTRKQIDVISRLFWQCYPRMYARFGGVSGAPTEVTLAIEDEGYEIAETAGSFVHLHDRWLEERPTDYDCLTHEFAHVIQNGWDEEHCEYGSYIERFADACRYEYALDDGYYNDACWTLWPVAGEPDRESSVRFLVWLDTVYSTPDRDLLLNFFRACWEETYPADRWDEAWREIFAGTALADMDIDEVWALYEASDFARLSAEAPEGETSELLTAYDVPGREPRN